MNSRFYGLQGLILAAALVASCKEDPTASLAGGPAGVELEFSLRKVVIDDSVLVTAIVRDALGTPLAVVPSFASRSATIATASLKGLSELRQVQFYVKGQNFGSTWIVATAGSLMDSMEVETFPKTLSVSGPPSVTSGQTPTYTFTYRSASGRNLNAQVPAATFSSSDPAVGVVNATTGALTALDFGAVDVIATGPGVDAIATGVNVDPNDTIGVRGRASVLVTPVAFAGTRSGVFEPGGIIKIVPGVGQVFDGDTRVFLNRVQLGTSTGTTGGEGVRFVGPDSITVRLDDVRPPGPYEVTFSRVGASQLSVGGDSITLAAPAFSTEGGTIAPATADPGQVVTLTAGSLAFDANSRVFFNGTEQSGTTSIRVDDLADSGQRAVLITRLGANDNARSGAFAVRVPNAFGGTVTPANGGPAQIVTLVRSASDPLFDADVLAFFKGQETFVDRSSGDTARIVVPPLTFIPSSPVVNALLTRIGAADNARAFPFTLAPPAANFFNDPYDVAGNNFAQALAGTAPEITQNGDYYIVLHGACSGGAGGTDCDDWFRIRNTGGATADSVAINVTWFTEADVDVLLGSNAQDVFDFVCDGPPLDDGCIGATGDNPENTYIDLPAGATYHLWLNLFDAGGAPATLARVRVTGLP